MSRVACLCLMACSLSGCGAAADEADQGEDVSGQGIHTCVVDPNSGADTAPPSGQLCETSRSITFQLARLALSSSTGVRVIVAPGTYTSASEQFPIVVPDGVTLQGDTSPGAAPVILQGSGAYTSAGGGQFQATAVLRGAGQLINVRIQSDQVGLLLDDTATGAAVQNVDIQPCLRGMVTLGTSVASVDALNVNQCQNTGIETHDTSAVTFTNSSTIANQVGVLAADQSQPVFGSDTGGSNTFAANVLCDFESQTSATLNLVGNTWGNDVFDIFPQSVCASGAALAITGTGNVIYQYLPNQNIPLFSATGPIALLVPQYGAFLNTVEPSFAWSAGSSSNKVALAVWDTAPDVGPDGIRNANHIVLFRGIGSPVRLGRQCDFLGHENAHRRQCHESSSATTTDRGSTVLLGRMAVG